MADTNFVVKNSLSVNSTFIANSTALYFGNTSSNVTINSTSLSFGPNSTIFVGNSSTNVTANTSALQIGANITINTSAYFVGNSSTNTYLTSTGLYVNGTAFQSGGGYYKGSNGVVGNTSNINNIFRINANTINANIEFLAGENAIATGPLTLGDSYSLIIDTGARVVIV